MTVHGYQESETACITLARGTHGDYLISTNPEHARFSDLVRILASTLAATEKCHKRIHIIPAPVGIPINQQTMNTDDPIQRVTYSVHTRHGRTELEVVSDSETQPEEQRDNDVRYVRTQPPGNPFQNIPKNKIVDLTEESDSTTDTQDS